MLNKILFAAYECKPFFKKGGLGDVAGSLPKALNKLDIDIRVVLPYYKEIQENYPQIKKIQSRIKVILENEELYIDIYSTVLPNSSVPIYFIANKNFEVDDIFDKNSRFRFALFSYLITKLPDIINWQPDIIHANDWHTGLVPVFITAQQKKIKTIFTIHNLAYSGDADLKMLTKFHLSEKNFKVIKNNQIMIMREAILSAHIVSTVSKTYAKEILTKEFGAGMEQALNKRKKDLYGIVNGIDYNSFDPSIDPAIKIKYDTHTLDHKLKNKLALQENSNLPQKEDIPIFAMITRLAGQKGLDLVEGEFHELMGKDIQLVILGTGEEKYEKFFAAMQKKYPNKFKVYLKFDITLARQIYAGADIFLMPSKYEPCGLGQLIAMRYGTIPLVKATGGLVDTVNSLNARLSVLNIVGQATGFSFREHIGDAMVKTIMQAHKIFFKKQLWRKLVINAMKQDFSWDSSAKKYIQLYQK